MEKKKVAFICVHNFCRSQIAEALGKYLAGDVFESYSAGTETKSQINRDGQVLYFQCQLVKPNLEINEFVIGFKNINEEKNIELAQQRKVEEALAAVEKANVALQEESAVSTARARRIAACLKLKQQQEQ